MMNMRDLIPWSRHSDQMPDPWRDERSSPFLSLQREMNRLLDEAFRAFEAPALIGRRGGMGGWPRIAVSDSDKDVTITAEVPGVDEKDVEFLLNDSNLIIRGEKKSEVEDKERQFSEHFYGRFERVIPLGGEIQEDKIEATFKNGVLKITLPKSEQAAARAKKIAINAPTKH